MIKRIALIGGGGHCKSCIDVIEHLDQFEIVGIIDEMKSSDDSLLGYPILGKDSDLPELIKKHSIDTAIVTTGQIKSAELRKRLYQLIIDCGLPVAKIVSPRAFVSRHAKIGDGTIVMHDALVMASAEIGVNCILNNKSLVEHDSKVGDHSHISTGAIVNGTNIIGNDSFVGSNSCTEENLVSDAGTILKAGIFHRKSGRS